jgi:hypothetical protein
VSRQLASLIQVFQNDIPGFPGEQSQSPADWVTFPGGVPVGKPQVEVKEKTGIPAEALYTELAGNVVTNINDLRLAEQLQKYLERAARAGTRLVEWIKGMFGVTLPDYTAQRPQYIGGTKSPVQISEVLNTTGTVDQHGLPKHKINRDQLSLFKTYEYSMRPYESYRLDWVASTSLKLPKLPYDGTLKDLRTNDLPTFLAYNAIDTIIVALLHKKHNLFNVLFGLCLVTSLPIRKVEGPVNQSEAVMFKHYLTKRSKSDEIIICPARPYQTTDKYEGGYVKDPVKHMSKYVACFDYSSLYPSIMRSHNIGPMNLIKQLTPDEIEQYKNNPDFSISVQGRLYDNSEDCAYKVVESELFIKRKKYQADQMFYWNEIFFKIQQEKKRRGLIDTL